MNIMSEKIMSQRTQNFSNGRKKKNLKAIEKWAETMAVLFDKTSLNT